MNPKARKYLEIMIIIALTASILVSAAYFEKIIKTFEKPSEKYREASVSQPSNVQAPSPSVPSAPSVSRTPAPVPKQVSYADLEQMLANNEMIKNLPENAVILLRFYNYGSQGEMIWEKSYILKRASVTQGIVESPDIALWIPSRYLARLTSNNFCDIIGQAKANQELSIRTELSTTSLLWKFRSMTKYRDCLGF